MAYTKRMVQERLRSFFLTEAGEYEIALALIAWKGGIINDALEQLVHELYTYLKKHPEKIQFGKFYPDHREPQIEALIQYYGRGEELITLSFLGGLESAGEQPYLFAERAPWQHRKANLERYKQQRAAR